VTTAATQARVDAPTPGVPARGGTGRGGQPRRAKAGGESASPISTALTMVFMVAMAVYFLLPVYWLIVAATTSTGDLFGTPGFWFARLNIVDNLQRVTAYHDGLFWRWMLNSIIYAGGGALLCAIVCALTGYALAKFRFPGRGLLSALILGSVLLPATVLVLPTYLMIARLDLLDTYWAVLLPSIVYPFGVFLAQLYAHTSVPDELLEAARLDGASELRIFRSIALPLMIPGMVTVFLFAIVQIWNNFFLPLMVLNDNDLFPVTLGLVFWNQQAITSPDLQSLVVIGSLLSLIPLVVLFFTMQRFWRSGLAAGSVKL
jgi:multiple sugar transport system permease protein